MLIVQDQIWGRVTANRSMGKATWYFADEFHLLLKEEQTAAYSAEIWKRFRKWGGIPTGATQNVKDLLSSPEIENILENSDFITLLNQASGDRKILAERLNLSPDHQKYIDNSEPGAGLLIFENVILPFTNPIPSNTELYKIMTTRLDRIEKDIQKVKSKIAEYNKQLRELEGQKTEQENLQIIQLVRGMNMTREEFAAFLRGGALQTAPTLTPYHEKEDIDHEE